MTLYSDENSKQKKIIAPNTMIPSTSCISSSAHLYHMCPCISEYLPSKIIWVWYIIIDYTWINYCCLYFLKYHEIKSKKSHFKHVYRYSSSSHSHSATSISKLWHVCTSTNGVGYTHTVHHVQGRVVMVSEGCGLINIATVRRGAVYGSRDTTE